MPTEQISVSLSPQLAKFVRGKVKAGLYPNVSELVREAIQRLQIEEAQSAPPPAAASGREGVLQGVHDLESGRYREFTEEGLKDYFAGVSERGKKRLAKRSGAQ